MVKKLNHPQVPTVFGAYIQQVNGRDLLHVVQEFVDGQDLQVWLKANTLSMSETRQILADTLGFLSTFTVQRHPFCTGILNRPT